VLFIHVFLFEASAGECLQRFGVRSCVYIIFCLRHKRKMEGATKLAPFNPSSKDVIAKTCDLAGVSSTDVVYDLGCGDGRLLVRLARDFKCKCVGVEYDETYVDRANKEVEFNKVGDLVEIRHADICKVDDLENATVIFMYLSVQGNVQLQTLIREAYNRGTRIVSNMFSLAYLGKPVETVECDGITRLYLYQNESGQPIEKMDEEEKGEEKEEGETWLEKLEWFFDPVRNPLVIKMFNIMIVGLVCTLVFIVYMGFGNVHIYNVCALTICLFISVNWFLGELKKAVAKEALENSDPQKSDKAKKTE